MEVTVDSKSYNHVHMHLVKVVAPTHDCVYSENNGYVITYM